MSDNSSTTSFTPSFSDSYSNTSTTTPDYPQSRCESETSDAVDQTNTAVNAAKVSSKLSSLKAATHAGAASISVVTPGSDEGHPNDPLLRVYDPTKDKNMSIEELLARPRLGRSPSQLAAMAKHKTDIVTAENSVLSTTLNIEEMLAAKMLREKAAAAAAEAKKAERERLIEEIKVMADELNANFTKN